MAFEERVYSQESDRFWDAAVRFRSLRTAFPKWPLEHVKWMLFSIRLQIR
jgi:hypothetical protein